MASQRIISLFVCATLAAGCATPSRAPVQDRSEPISKPAIKTSGEYIVRPNDSLYAIAWKYQLDYRDIARRNGIAAPYTIYPGQKLLLYGMKSEPSAATDSTGASIPAPVQTKPKTAARPAQPPAPPVAKPVARPVAKPVARPVTKPVAKPVVEPVAKPVAKSVTKTAPRARPTPSTAQKSAPSQPARAGWRWPVNTQPARGFGRGNNGLDYLLPNGHRVVAAAAGEVVYAGAGIGGYRYTIIVMHSDTYLSAYNINVEPAVAEGSRIASGGKICDIGSGSPTTRRLHFEIRRNGAPVDPAKVIGRG